MAKPPEDLHRLGDLPEATQEPHVAILTKRFKYVSIVLRPQAEEAGHNVAVFTLHQNEAQNLARALLDVATSPVREDFVDEARFGTAGIFLGGPPRRDQLVDFNPSLLRGKAPDA